MEQRISLSLSLPLSEFLLVTNPAIPGGLLLHVSGPNLSTMGQETVCFHGFVCLHFLFLFGFTSFFSRVRSLKVLRLLLIDISTCTKMHHACSCFCFTSL